MKERKGVNMKLNAKMMLVFTLGVFAQNASAMNFHYDWYQGGLTPIIPQGGPIPHGPPGNSTSPQGGGPVIIHGGGGAGVDTRPIPEVGPSNNIFYALVRQIEEHRIAEAEHQRQREAEIEQQRQREIEAEQQRQREIEAEHQRAREAAEQRYARQDQGQKEYIADFCSTANRESAAWKQHACFAGDTLVLVQDLRTEYFYPIPIKDVKEGDFVISCNLYGGGTCEIDRVTNTSYRIVKKLLKLEFSNGDILRTTKNHPIYVVEKEDYVPADDLNHGDTFLTYSGDNVTLQSKTPLEGEFLVYNLEVERNHNFYASDILVHNCNIRDQVRHLIAQGVTATMVGGIVVIDHGLSGRAAIGAARLGARVIARTGIGIIPPGAFAIPTISEEEIRHVLDNAEGVVYEDVRDAASREFTLEEKTIPGVDPKIHSYGNPDKLRDQMKQRKWTEERIRATLENGIKIYEGEKGKNGPAIRYIDRETGKTFLVDEATGEIFHIGGEDKPVEGGLGPNAPWDIKQWGEKSRDNGEGKSNE